MIGQAFSDEFKNCDNKEIESTIATTNKNILLFLIIKREENKLNNKLIANKKIK